MKLKTVSEKDIYSKAYYSYLNDWVKARDRVDEYERVWNPDFASDDYYVALVEREHELWEKQQELHDILLAYEQMDNRRIEPHDFLDDAEKMRDFCELSKEEFLASYSYLTEEEYNLTMEKLVNK